MTAVSLGLAIQPAHAKTFHVYVLSDTQHPWTRDMDKDDDEIWNESIRLILSQFWTVWWDSQNNIPADYKGHQGPRATFINGDLTAFGHANELDKFKDLLGLLESWLPSPTRHYLGLGNHDIGNNIDDTYRNQAAKRMWDYMHEHVKDQDSWGWRSFDYLEPDIGDTYYKFPMYRKEYSGALWYSWRIWGVHFIQLQNYPSFEANWDGWNSAKARREYFTMEPDWEWLETDMYNARKRGDAIVVMAHQGPWHHDFDRMMRQYDVSAYFAGHLHGTLGRSGSASYSNTKDSYSEAVPRFRSGAASRGIDLDTLTSGGDGATNESVAGSLLRVKFDTDAKEMTITPIGTPFIMGAYPTIGLDLDVVPLRMHTTTVPEGLSKDYFVIQNGPDSTEDLCAEIKYNGLYYGTMYTMINKLVIPPGYEKRFRINNILHDVDERLSVNVYRDNELVADRDYGHAGNAARCLRSEYYRHLNLNLVNHDCGSGLKRDKSQWASGDGDTVLRGNVSGLNCLGGRGDSGNH